MCGLAFWNSFRAGLILDNIPIILQDPRLRTVGWQSVHDILTHDYWWPSGDSNLYRPFSTLSYWFNYSVLGGGGNPAGYHAVNLLLHWLNTVLAFLLVRGVTGRAWAALVTAAVLACHPLTVESVTNVVGRADLLAGLSILGGLCLYRRYHAAAGRRRLPWLVGLGAAYFLGVFSKESAVVLPALMLLHDGVLPPAVPGPTRTATLRQSAARVWPAYAAVVPGLVSLFWARSAVLRDSALLVQFGGDNLIANAPFWTGAMTAVKVAGYYLALFAWPARLSCDYSYNAVTLFGWTLASGQDPHAWLAWAAILVLAAVAVIWRRHQPAIPFFLGLAGIAFLPTSNLLFPIGTVMAERLMYVPLVGLAAAAVLLIIATGERLPAARSAMSPRRFAGVGLLVAAVIGALAVRTANRNEDWTGSMRLWSSAARAVPGSFKVYKALALATMESDPSGGRVDDAIDLAARSIGIVEQAHLPLHQLPASLYAEAGWYRVRKAQLLSGRGSASDAQAEIVQSVALLERAEAIDREANRRARETRLGAGVRPEEIHDSGSAFIYRTLATAYLGAGDPLRAVTSAEYLQRIAPGHFDAHYMRGVAEAAAAQFEDGRGRPQEAGAHLERAAISLMAATILNPAHRESWSLLAKVYQYLAPSPPAVIIADGGGRLNRENPVVVRDVQLACAQLLAQLRTAGLRDDAAAVRGRMIEDLGVPAALLDAAPGPGR